MNELCYIVDNPHTGKSFGGGCPFKDDLHQLPASQLHATARCLFLEDWMGLGKDETLSTDEFKLLDRVFDWDNWNLDYYIKEA